MSWYFRRNGQQFGPVSATDLQELARRGELSPHDEVRAEGVAGWDRAGSYRILFDPGYDPSSQTPSIYLGREGRRSGPFSAQQISNMLATGAATAGDLAWREGAANWQPLRQLLGEPAGYKSYDYPSYDYPSYEDEAYAHLKGVGGWLLFFCIVLTIISPLLTLGIVWGSWNNVPDEVLREHPSLETAIFVENLGSVLVVCYQVVVGIMIWSGNPSGRRLARTFLIVRLAASFVFGIIVLGIMSDLPEYLWTVALWATIRGLFGHCIFFGIWWSYFQRSVRVRNTYGRE